MYKGLQAGFGTSISADIPEIRSIGVEQVRLDCKGLDAATTAQLAHEPAVIGLVPLVIADTTAQLAELPPGTHVELLNEPDLNGPEPPQYFNLVKEFAPICAAAELFLWAGSISNLNDRGFTYLRKAHVREWPDDVNISIHRYPNGNSPLTPHDGFESRYDEIATLKTLIGDRRWICSEYGYHTANRATKWWQKLLGIERRWTDAQVKEFVAWEWDFWEKAGAVMAVLYQLNDGPSEATLDCYGIRYLEGGWKPVADTFA